MPAASPERAPRHAGARVPVVGVLLAAGEGRRFDPSGRRCKLLAPLPDDGEPVLRRAARQLRAAVGAVCAVVPWGRRDLAELLESLGCEVAMAPDAERRQSLSLATAVRMAPEAAALLVALGDMPWIRTSSHQAVGQALQEGADIVQASFEGRPGHPVGFSPRHRAALLACSGDQGARELLRLHPVRPIAVSDPGIWLDIDRPQDLRLHPLPQELTP